MRAEASCISGSENGDLAAVRLRQSETRATLSWREMGLNNTEPNAAASALFRVGDSSVHMKWSATATGPGAESLGYSLGPLRGICIIIPCNVVGIQASTRRRQHWQSELQSLPPNSCRSVTSPFPWSNVVNEVRVTSPKVYPVEGFGTEPIPTALPTSKFDLTPPTRPSLFST